jgi:NAD(P)-dependent dehydrogenase (short-subunit alcohol dehydrogenase family)
MATTGERAAGVAVITGAASGMGYAAARLMGEAGWPLLICDLNLDRLEQAAETLKVDGPVETLAGDIADPAFAARLTAAVAGRGVGAVIHCAGLSPSMASPERILEVNLAASMRLADAVLPLMSDGSAVVLFASTAGHMLGASLDEAINGAATSETVASLAPYAATPEMAYTVSKRGVHLLVRRLAGVFGAKGARINSVSPGIIDTPMGQAELATQPAMQHMVDMNPLPRMAKPEEVAAAAVFLCSPAASFISGTDLLVDGGSIGAMRVSGMAPAG